MFHRYPAAQSPRPFDARFSRQPQPSLHSSHQVGGLHQLRGPWILGTPHNGFGLSGPFYEISRTNGALASLRMRNDVLLSVIRELGLQPSSGCGCHSPGPCQCHHHHQDKE